MQKALSSFSLASFIRRGSASNRRHFALLPNNNMMKGGGEVPPELINNHCAKDPQEVEEEEDGRLATSGTNHPAQHICSILCYPRDLFRAARLVGYLSLSSVLINFLFVVFGNSQTVFHIFFELLLLLVELLAILSLFHGISHQSAGCLKPFLLWNLLWSLSLFVLWLFCLIEVLQQKQEFLEEVVDNFSHFITLQRKEQDNYRVGMLLSITLLLGLGLMIVIGFWFLNIVLLTYFHLRRCKKQWNSYSEAEKALLSTPVQMPKNYR